MEHDLAHRYRTLIDSSLSEGLLAVVGSCDESLDSLGFADGFSGALIPDLVRLTSVRGINGQLIERRPYKISLGTERASTILGSDMAKLEANPVPVFRPMATSTIIKSTGAAA